MDIFVSLPKDMKNEILFWYYKNLYNNVLIELNSIKHHFHSCNKYYSFVPSEFYNIHIISFPRRDITFNYYSCTLSKDYDIDVLTFHAMWDEDDSYEDEKYYYKKYKPDIIVAGEYPRFYSLK